MEVDPQRIERRLATRYVDEATSSLDEALALTAQWSREKRARSIALCANAADVLPALVARGIRPDVVTDQTSAHDPLNGYVPNGCSLDEAVRLRAADPDQLSVGVVSRDGRARRARCCAMRRNGAVVFDYGNNLRAQAVRGGTADAFEIPGFVPEYIRPLFCEGKGPFRWAALSGDPDDIRVDRRCRPRAVSE